MGQKIHPVGLRLGITRTWDSRWFEKKHYRDWLLEDHKIRKYFTRWMRPAAISRIEIERRANQMRVIINTGKPGIIIGKRGVGIEEIRKGLETLTGKVVQVNVMEIKHPELDARLVGQNIVDQLEKRIAFRRAMKQAIMRSMRAGARGIKVQVSGRLGGAEIARTERNHDGKVPLHTLRADIDYAHVEAFTTFGRIGVKVWIYRGEVLPEHARGPEARGPQFPQRRERGGRSRRPAVRPADASGESTTEFPVADVAEAQQFVPEETATGTEPVASAEPVAVNEPEAAQPEAATQPEASAQPETETDRVASTEPVAASELEIVSEPVAEAPVETPAEEPAPKEEASE